MPCATIAPAPTLAEFSARDAWINRHLLRAQSALPFSFSHGGADGAALLAGWARHEEIAALDAHRTQYTLTWTQPDGPLQVRCAAVVYDDFPTVEWTVYWKNIGDAPTPLLAELQGIDLPFTRQGAAEFVLHHADGDLTAPGSYAPHALPLEPASHHTFAPPGGRPTFGAYPFFNIAFDGGGVIAVLGWPGQWAAHFTRDDAATLRVTGGQELTALVLRPGEEVRAPLVALQFWQGDLLRAQNLWRRWMLAHNTPRAADKLPAPLLASLMIVGPDLTAANQIDFIDTWKRNGIALDYWWVDAGWYPCGEHWSQVGTWEADAPRFPHGMQAVGEKAHAEGMGLILWFEPERVSPGSWLVQTHPEWCLSVGDGDRLLNLGHPEAQQWVTTLIDEYLTHQGVDVYRQDFNIDPLAFWRAADAPDRQGMTENLYVQGYLAFFDALRRRHPAMIIDSCTSGGRRNDLETLRRAISLCRSDFQNPQGRFFAPDDRNSIMVGNQGQTYGLSFWVPCAGGISYYEDDYDRRSHYSPTLCLLPRDFCEATMQHFCGQPRIYELLGEVDWPAFRRGVAEWRQVADAFLGDYYPLTAYNRDEAQWLAWQYDRPETGAGIIQAFRRTAADADTLRVTLQGLDPAAVYELTDADAPQPVCATGRALREDGYLVHAPTRPYAALISYRRVE